jgi:hypothetical protein
MKTLVIWNDNPFAQQLGDTFGKANVVVNSHDLLQAKKQLQECQAIIVLCELDWYPGRSHVYKQQFMGIDLIKRLRLNDELNQPVLFVSFMPLHRLFTGDREILTAIGHDFFRLPAAPDGLEGAFQTAFGNGKAIPKLSIMELNDIKSFYCSKEGILSHEIHYLNTFLNILIAEYNREKILQLLEASVRKIHGLFFADPTPAITQLFFGILSTDTINEKVAQIIDAGIGLAKAAGDEKPARPNHGQKIKYPWKVLLLDDEIDESHPLVIAMEDFGLDVLCHNNAGKAKEAFLLDRSSSRKIMTIIADYRLYEKQSRYKRHQKIQGYQFLRDIAASDHLVRLVAFSHLQRKFLLDSFKYFNIRTDVKSKFDYFTDTESVQNFCNEIIALSKENQEAEEAVPETCTPFRNSLLETYKRYRRLSAYEKMEWETSRIAADYCRVLEDQIRHQETLKIPAIPFITTALAKKEKNEEARFRKFQQYLIGRRIALWLYAVNKTPRGPGIDPRQIARKIAEILVDKAYPPKSGFYRQILSTYLGLSLDDFPFNITIEERYWLHYEMELPIIREVNATLPVFAKCAIYFQEFIQRHADLKQVIEDERFKLGFVYKGNKNNDNNQSLLLFHRDFRPQLKTPGQVREAYWLFAQLSDRDKLMKQSLDKTTTFICRALKDSFEQTTGYYIGNLYTYFSSIVSQYATSKNSEAQQSRPDNQLIYDALVAGKDYKSIQPHLQKLYASGFMAKYDLEEGGLELNEDTKPLFFKEMMIRENAERLDPEISLTLDKKRKAKDY